MYRTSYIHIHPRSYGILCRTQTAPDANGVVNYTQGFGSGFAIAPGIIVTAAHVIHQQGILTNPLFNDLHVIRAPEVGGGMPIAVSLIAESANNDIALLRIENPVNSDFVTLTNSLPQIGRSVGAIGFPNTVANNTAGTNGEIQVHISMEITFVGSHVSNLNQIMNYPDRSIRVFMTDGNVYEGASGGPVFTTNGKVCGMQVGYRRNANNERLSFTNCIPSSEIIAFAVANGITGLRTV